MVVEHSETWDKLNFSTFCWVFFLVVSFSWSSINCFTEFMSANLEAMILGKQETLQTFTLNYFAWPPRKAGKTDTNSLIGHTIFFTSENNRMTNEIAFHQWETNFLFGEFSLSKSQYLYNKYFYYVFVLYLLYTYVYTGEKFSSSLLSLTITEVRSKRCALLSLLFTSNCF